MVKIWHDCAWDDYLYWHGEDKKTLKRIHQLIQSIERNGYNCIGNPEPLKGNLSSWWSVRIKEKDRLVFKIDESGLHILGCKGHYA